MLSGGGSAALKPSFFTTPYDGIVQSIGEISKDVEITYSEGAVGMYSQTLDCLVYGNDNSWRIY